MSGTSGAPGTESSEFILDVVCYFPQVPRYPPEDNQWCRATALCHGTSRETLPAPYRAPKTPASSAQS